MSVSFREPALESREMSWRGFGWPRWSLATPLLPLAALHAAVRERKITADQECSELRKELTWDRSEITGAEGAPTQWWPEALLAGCPRFLETGQAAPLTSLGAIDRSLKDVCGLYLDDREGGEVADMPFWTFGALLEAACGITGDAEPVMPNPYLASDEEGNPRWPRKPLTPQWPYRWLLQRKAAVGLLRRYRVPALCDFEKLNGSVHTGVPTSPQEALEAAAGESEEPREAEGQTDFQSTANLIYGPDHGWNEGTYCCNLLYVTRLHLSDGQEGDFWLKAEPPDGDPEHFDGFGVLHPGWNLLDGETEFPNVLAFQPPTPVADRQELRGWRATAWVCREGAFHFT